MTGPCRTTTAAPCTDPLQGLGMRELPFPHALEVMGLCTGILGDDPHHRQEKIIFCAILFLLRRKHGLNQIGDGTNSTVPLPQLYSQTVLGHRCHIALPHNNQEDMVLVLQSGIAMPGVIPLQLFLIARPVAHFRRKLPSCSCILGAPYLPLPLFITLAC